MVGSKLIFLSLFFLLTFSCLSCAIPIYTIDLDEAPEIRWKQVAIQYKAQIKVAITKGIKLLKLPTILVELLQSQGPAILDYLPKDYANEIVGISQQTGISLTDMVVANILYDVTAACTSIIAQTNDGKIIHARNLDYSLAEELRNLTILVVAKRKGIVVFSGVTFAGMVGMATGQKPNLLTVSFNERNKGSLWENVYEILLDRQAHFVTFEIRRVLEMPDVDYASALKEFQISVTMAPCYIILGGVKPGEGSVITRGRESELSVRFLDADSGHWYVLETNYDWWTPPPSQDNRRGPAIEHMDRIGQSNISLSALYEVLSTPPVCNPRTAYTALMSAADPQALRAEIRNADSPCLKA